MTESTTQTSPAGDQPEVPEAVSANPAHIHWPSDKWGYTSKMRKELLAAASTIQGQPDKAKLFLATLDLMRSHVIARFKQDQGKVRLSAKQAAFYAGERHKRGLK